MVRWRTEVTSGSATLSDPGASRGAGRYPPPSAVTPTNVLPDDEDQLLDAVDAMTPEELDSLPYGIIQLDAQGRILKYNAVESRLASLPQEQQIGKQFFTEVAPCTKVQAFHGRFREGVIREALDVSFHFHFAFKQKPRDVTVRLFYSRRTRSVWVLVSDREGRPILDA